MYFCITTDKNDMYDGFKYKTGLNENVPNNIKIHCNKYICGEIKPNDIYIRYVILLPDTKSVKNCSFDIGQNKYMLLYRTVSDKIYLSERYYLYDFRTICKFNLNVSDNYLNNCCRYGAINVLERLKISEVQLLNNSVSALINASENGHEKVLEWWFKNNLSLKYADKSINLACANGHVRVLELLKNYYPEFKCPEHAILWTSYYGHIDVLEWWFNSGVSLQYSLKSVLCIASINRKIQVLDWWLKTTLNVFINTGDEDCLDGLKFNKSLYDDAITHGHTEIVKWWEKIKPPV